MRRRYFIEGLSAALLCSPFLGLAQPSPSRVRRVGFLTGAGLSDPLIDGWKQGLREARYTEGKNLQVEWRSADGNAARLPKLAADLVNMKVEVIVANASVAAFAAKRATKEIPIVFTLVSDPVTLGLVQSMARPDANVTGISGVRDATAGKELEILKEAVPAITTVTLLCGPRQESSIELNLRSAQVAAQSLGLKSRIVEVKDPSKIEESVRGIARGHREGIFLVPSPWLFLHRVQIAQLAAKQGNPTVGWQSVLAEGGALLSYGASSFEIGRRAAALVARLLDGVRPTDIPVEEPTVFELVINLRTAKTIGLELPKSILGRADRVIE